MKGPPVSSNRSCLRLLGLRLRVQDNGLQFGTLLPLPCLDALALVLHGFGLGLVVVVQGELLPTLAKKSKVSLMCGSSHK